MSRSRMRAWRVPAIAGIALLCLPAIAGAQISMRPIPGVWAGLDRDDMARIAAAATPLFDDMAAGSEEPWSNPASGNAGTVRLVRSFTFKSMPCRALDYTIRFARNAHAPARYALTWCHVEGRDWKIVETGARRAS